MRNPLWRLKTLPWVTLLQNALLTVLLATLLDIALLGILMIFANPGAANIGLSIPGGIFGVNLLLLMIAGGVGALAVTLMERIFPNIILDAATLWALVGCLGIVLFLKTLTPIPIILVGFSRLQFIGMIFGLFAQGRHYWRR
ncbi:MAG: peptide chain release factor 1 [Leptolyngbya sp. SIO1E4]|nr:peptide chain release factor 1 [Leptolyngbya sp. SIO1E4]